MLLVFMAIGEIDFFCFFSSMTSVFLKVVCFGRRDHTCFFFFQKNKHTNSQKWKFVEGKEKISNDLTIFFFFRGARSYKYRWWWSIPQNPIWGVVIFYLIDVSQVFGAPHKKKKHIFSRIFFFMCRLYDKIYHIFLSQNDVDTRRNNRRRRGKKVLRNYFVTFSFCCLVFVLLVNVESQLTLDPISLRCLVHFGGDLRRHRQLQPSEMKERENCCVFSIFTATSSRTISPHHIESKKKQQVKKENWNLNCDPAAVFLKVKKISYFGI